MNDNYTYSEKMILDLIELEHINSDSECKKNSIK